MKFIVCLLIGLFSSAYAHDNKFNCTLINKEDNKVLAATYSLSGYGEERILSFKDESSLQPYNNLFVLIKISKMFPRCTVSCYKFNYSLDVTIGSKMMATISSDENGEQRSYIFLDNTEENPAENFSHNSDSNVEPEILETESDKYRVSCMRKI